MWELKDLEALLKVFYIEKKGDLSKYCREASIFRSDFAAFVLACDTGAMPWLHQIHYRDYVPEHLHPTDVEREALAKNGVGQLKGDALKMVNKVSQIFKDRRYLVGHMFFTPRLEQWHFFYFDQRDTAEGENHWDGGAHIHLINHLWPNYDPQELWKTFCSGNAKLSGSFHLRFADGRNAT